LVGSDIQNVIIMLYN